jgi:glycosyltransferase involved in cell wall biosynthesis
VVSSKSGPGRKLYSDQGILAIQGGLDDAVAILSKNGRKPTHLLSESLFSPDSSSIAKQFNAKHIVRIHEELPLTGGAELWLTKCKPIAEYFQNAVGAHIVFTSHHTAKHYDELIQRYGIRASVIHGTIDEKRLEPAFVPTDSPFTILQLGTIYKRKGTLETLRAFAEFFKKPGVDARLELIGARYGSAEEHAYIDNVIRTVRELGIERQVTVLGIQDDPIAALQRASVLTLHSKSESFPTVFLEAMYCGKPVVSTPAGGVCEQVIDGETGILFPEGNIHAQAAAFDSIYRNQKLWKQRSTTIRATYDERFAANRLHQRWMELLQGENYGN